MGIVFILITIIISVLILRSHYHNEDKNKLIIGELIYNEFEEDDLIDNSELIYIATEVKPEPAIERFQNLLKK